MQADCHRVNIQVEGDNIRVIDHAMELEMIGKEHSSGHQNVVQLVVPLPEFAVQVIPGVRVIRAMQVSKVLTKKTGHNNHTSKRRELRGSVWSHSLR